MPHCALVRFALSARRVEDAEDFFYKQFLRTEPDGIRIVWKFCPGQYGQGQIK